MRHHYAPVTEDGVVRDFSVPVVVNGGNEWIRFVVYERQKAMLTAAQEFNGVADPESDVDTWGVTQGWGGTGLMSDEESRVVVRLCLAGLTRSIVVHELVHAVQWIYNWGALPWAEGNPWDLNNEVFAYMFQCTYDMVMEQMRWNTSLHPDGPDAFGPDVFARCHLAEVEL